MLISALTFSLVFTSCDKDDDDYDTSLGGIDKNSTLVGTKWYLEDGKLDIKYEEDGESGVDHYAPNYVNFISDKEVVADGETCKFSYDSKDYLKVVYEYKGTSTDEDEEGNKIEIKEESVRIYEGIFTINGTTGTFDCHFTGYDWDSEDGSEDYDTKGVLTYSKESND